MTLPEIDHVSFLVEHAQTFFAGEYVSHFHASRMRCTVWKYLEIVEANENKRKLGGSKFHCFVFKFSLF